MLFTADNCIYIIFACVKIFSNVFKSFLATYDKALRMESRAIYTSDVQSETNIGNSDTNFSKKKYAEFLIFQSFVYI